MADVKKFTWDTTLEDTRGKKSYNKKTISLGDGYKSEVSFGINNISFSWDIGIVGSYGELEPIEEFLDSTAGVKRFLWDSPRGTIKVVCSDTSLEPLGGDLWKLTTTFDQRF